MASFEGVGALACCCFSIAAGLSLLNLFDGRLVPESVPIIGGTATLVLMLSGRYASAPCSRARAAGRVARLAPGC